MLSNLNLNSDMIGIQSFIKGGKSRNESTGKSFHYYKKGQSIFFPDQEARHLFMILSGSVRIFNYSDDGQLMVRSILFDGEIFGEEAIATDPPKRAAHAVAQEDNTIINQLSIQALTVLMSADPELGKQIIKLMADKLTQASREMEIIKLDSAHQKLIGYLKNLAERKGRKVGFEIMIKNRLTHMDIASLIGISRQTVTSLLNSYKRKNLINFNRKQFLIRDMNKLI